MVKRQCERNNDYEAIINLANQNNGYLTPELIKNNEILCYYPLYMINGNINNEIEENN